MFELLRDRPRALAVDTPARHPVGEPVVELDDVAKVYGRSGAGSCPAVVGLTLALRPGTATLVTGPSGSGKSTVLGLIGCLIRPTRGRLMVAGEDVTRATDERLSALRRHCLGFVFQGLDLVRGMSSLDNVLLPALPGPESTPVLTRRAVSLLRRLGLGPRLHQRVERLSGGEQQRVVLARALINRPRVLIADEPTAHLDEAAGRAFVALAAELLAEGVCLVVASHDPVVCGADLFATRITLRRGRVLRGV